MPRKKKVFSAFNAHFPACGQPPHVEASGAPYSGYYENRFGEQWIFRYDASTGVAELRGGDVGWERTFEMRLREPGWAGKLPVLNTEEQEWLSVCVRTATGQAGHQLGLPAVLSRPTTRDGR